MRYGMMHILVSKRVQQFRGLPSLLPVLAATALLAVAGCSGQDLTDLDEASLGSAQLAMMDDGGEIIFVEGTAPMTPFDFGPDLVGGGSGGVSTPPEFGDGGE